MKCGSEVEEDAELVGVDRAVTDGVEASEQRAHVVLGHVQTQLPQPAPELAPVHAASTERGPKQQGQSPKKI